MGTQKVLIFGSMPCPSWDFLRPYEHWADLVIAADGGVQCAMDAGFTPDIYVGDSDSGGHALIGMECIPAFGNRCGPWGSRQDSRSLELR